MTETTDLTTHAAEVLDQAYAQFKQTQLQRPAAELFDDAEKIFAIREITAATRQYLFDEAIATKVVALGHQVLTQMYAQATQTEFLKLNFTGNDIRWLLGLPRAHRRQR
ncbi:hypothetical protein D1831_08340 [Lactiplantibacillus garii]|uniref:Uncharacterized protein n=1 Tax=Lactiplantibacillus garii TaxID=2306423 RepID=A0A3R8L0N0_9LACO|nr:hypothetical protein [Lactiplantibacillus garii]RRK10236.1 hypothetical protein D1831_08340 [Lactiplantibacillus garii]